MTKAEIAHGLWAEYLRVDSWPLQTEEGAHGAKCAIRCVAVKLGVYPEFIALDTPAVEVPENHYSQDEINRLCFETGGRD